MNHLDKNVEGTESEQSTSTTEIAKSLILGKNKAAPSLCRKKGNHNNRETNDRFKIASPGNVDYDDSDVNASNTSDDSITKYTDDGFKVVSSIPDDDSDVSDAFETDSDEELSDTTVLNESKSKTNFVANNCAPKYTDDGFKVVSSIPDDDSDISDAFSSGDENENCKDVIINKKQLHLKIQENKMKSRSGNLPGIGISIMEHERESTSKLDQEESKPKPYELFNHMELSALKTKSARKRYKKKLKAIDARIPFTDEELAELKARFPRQVQKMIDDLGKKNI